MQVIKNNIKYIFIISLLTIIVIFIIGYYYNQNQDKTIKKEEIKKTEQIEKKEEKEDNFFIVDIKGAINKPGVYKLKENSRIMDVINMAEGLKEEADTSIINLSKKIEDEMVIIIYTKDEINNYKNVISSEKIKERILKERINIDKNNDAEIKEEKPKNEENDNEEDDKLVNINTANKEKLLTVKGIGESKADAIISYRKENGDFKSIDDIKNVSGIGEALFDKIKEYITV